MSDKVHPATEPRCNGKCRGHATEMSTSEWSPDPRCPLHSPQTSNQAIEQNNVGVAPLCEGNSGPSATSSASGVISSNPGNDYWQVKIETMRKIEAELRARNSELSRLLAQQLNPATRVENPVPCHCPYCGQPHGVNQSAVETKCTHPIDATMTTSTRGVWKCRKCGALLHDEPTEKTPARPVFESQGGETPGWCKHCDYHRSMHRDQPGQPAGSPEWCPVRPVNGTGD